MRKELRCRGIEHLKVVFSTQQPIEVKEKYQMAIEYYQEVCFLCLHAED
ncbi:hypothetical protein [Terrisporobacter petrolearius]